MSVHPPRYSSQHSSAANVVPLLDPTGTRPTARDGLGEPRE